MTVSETDALLCEALATLIEAHDCIAGWGCYASKYFQEKHDLEGDLASVRATIDKIRTALEPAKRRPEPDEERVERVARAIYEASITGEERHHDAWDDIPEPYRGQLLVEARAAIRAMEE